MERAPQGGVGSAGLQTRKYGTIEQEGAGPSGRAVCAAGGARVAGGAIIRGAAAVGYRGGFHPAPVPAAVRGGAAADRRRRDRSTGATGVGRTRQVGPSAQGRRRVL